MQQVRFPTDNRVFPRADREIELRFIGNRSPLVGAFFSYNVLSHITLFLEAFENFNFQNWPITFKLAMRSDASDGDDQ